MDPARQNISTLVTENDATQARLNQFVKSLQDLSLSKEQVEEIAISVAKTAANQTTAKISILMNDTDWDKWKAFVDTGANAAQQIVIMNKFLMDRTNKNIEMLQLEILDSLMKDTLDQIQKGNELALKASKLSDEEVDRVMEELDNGNYDKAEDILNKVNN